MVTQDVVVGTRPRRFAATPDGKELWVTAELSGEVYIIDRAKFEVAGKIEFLPPGMRKTDVTPVGLVMTKDGKTAYRHARPRRARGGGRRADAQGPGYILVGKRSWGITLSRDETHAVCRQRLRRRHHRSSTSRAARPTSPSRSGAFPGAWSSMISACAC